MKKAAYLLVMPLLAVATALGLTIFYIFHAAIELIVKVLP